MYLQPLQLQFSIIICILLLCYSKGIFPFIWKCSKYLRKFYRNLLLLKGGNELLQISINFLPLYVSMYTSTNFTHQIYS